MKSSWLAWLVAWVDEVLERGASRPDNSSNRGFQSLGAVGTRGYVGLSGSLLGTETSSAAFVGDAVAFTRTRKPGESRKQKPRDRLLIVCDTYGPRRVRGDPARPARQSAVVAVTGNQPVPGSKSRYLLRWTYVLNRMSDVEQVKVPVVSPQIPPPG